MSEHLVIRPDPSPRETAAWVAVDQTGALLGPPGHGELAQATQAAAGRQVIALLPGLEVLRIRAEVPVKTGGKLLQALPFALEDQLAEDVDELHFAAGGRDAQDRVPVAIIRRDAMSRWRQRFADAGLSPAKIYSESDAIAGMPNTATLMVQSDGALLLTPDEQVISTDCEGLEAVLDLWLARRGQAESAGPLNLVIYGTPDALEPLDALWESLRPRMESLEVRAMPEGPLPRLAAQIVSSPGINLLQGEYAQRSSLGVYWPAWQSSAALLALLAVVLIAVQWLDLRRMNKEIAALDQSIDQAFHYVFPDAGPVTDARAELSARLQQLGGAAAPGGQAYLDVLGVVAKAVSAEAKTRIEGMSYRTGTLELRLRAPGVESLDRIQQSVTQSGALKAQIQSANAEGSEVVGRLQITRAGS